MSSLRVLLLVLHLFPFLFPLFFKDGGVPVAKSSSYRLEPSTRATERAHDPGDWRGFRWKFANQRDRTFRVLQRGQILVGCVDTADLAALLIFDPDPPDRRVLQRARRELSAVDDYFHDPGLDAVGPVRVRSRIGRR